MDGYWDFPFFFTFFEREMPSTTERRLARSARRRVTFYDRLYQRPDAPPRGSEPAGLLTVPGPEKLNLWTETPTRISLLNPPPAVTMMFQRYAARANVKRTLYPGWEFCGEPRFQASGYMDPNVQQLGYAVGVGSQEIMGAGRSILMANTLTSFCPRYTLYALEGRRFEAPEYELHTVLFQYGDRPLGPSIETWLRSLTEMERECVVIYRWTESSTPRATCLRILKDWALNTQGRLPRRFLGEFKKLIKEDVEGTGSVVTGEMTSAQQTGFSFRVQLPEEIPETFEVVLEHPAGELGRLRVIV
ncbi:ORF18b [black bullhead herpesvirus]|uniref:ORF18b n=1 Tax=black bullhead herpesvirus TaxID=508441 RepID=A0A2H5AJG0_9VIRU|nr:ORF18b [black bullhead herpesvirus]AUG72274.1 ORF18b [black bullhead herpesvirus]